MAARRKGLEARLARAVSEVDGQAVEAVTEELIDDIRGSGKLYSEKEAHALLGQLRGIREFGLMQRISDALIQSGQDSFQVRRQYAQSLLDQGNITSAIYVLNKLAKDAKGRNRREHLEAQGLSGRAYKQLYVQAKKKRRLGDQRPQTGCHPLLPGLHGRSQGAMARHQRGGAAAAS